MHQPRNWTSKNGGSLVVEHSTIHGTKRETVGAVREVFEDQETDRFERVRGIAIYEIEKIIDHCRDQEGWRLRAIREAAQKIESAFID